MRLSRIEIENFKGIGAKQVINLAPITLLFGPNSAGKSTILQSLHYVREVLSRGNPDPDQTIAGGLIDLGGFAKLIHGHDLSRTMTIKLVLNGLDGFGSDRLPLNSGASLKSPEFDNLPIRYLVGENTDLKDYAVVQSIGVGISVSWSNLNSEPYVSLITVQIDGDDIATITSPAEPGQAVISEFNANHPLLQQYRDADFDPNEIEAEGTNPFLDEIYDLSRQMAITDPRSHGDAQLTPKHYRVGVKTISGALPELATTLISDLRDPDVRKFEHETSSPRVKALASILDELMIGPLRIIRDYLDEMTYVGPLREIPTRGFRPQRSPDESRWAQGLAAWDLLYTDSKEELLKRVNHWLADKRRLGTTYEIVRIQQREVPVPSRFNQIFERGLTEDDIAELQEEYGLLKSRAEIALRDFEKGIIVAPADVGVGISQMIPVIVASFVSSSGLLSIEQPELHVHPAVQVGLGDLFIDAVWPGAEATLGNKTLLMETHSEHIILRLLRRIREKSADNIPPGFKGITPDDLSVIYVENGATEVTFRRLRVDFDGDFLDRWPHGFFDERSEELF